MVDSNGGHVRSGMNEGNEGVYVVNALILMYYGLDKAVIIQRTADP